MGDELLLGIRLNSHLAYLGAQLSRQGLYVERSVEVRDDEEEIRAAFAAAWQRADIVITTGGLGPTEDDLTRESLAHELGRDLVFDEKQAAHIADFFGRRGLPAPTNNKRQCYRIEEAELLANPHGTAPGMWFEEEGKILILLPGPTKELRPMVQEQVVPRLEEKGIAREDEAYLQIRTTGIGESQLAETLAPLLDPVRDRVQVAYCAHEGIVDMRLSALGGGASASDIRLLGEACRDRLGPDFACYGDTCIAALLLRQIRALGKTLAVAESCTGGLLASHFTDVAGASKVFSGSVVCYRNEVKVGLLGVPEDLIEQHGAVSEECAIAMATGVAEMLESDYGLAITGYAGPEAGNEPVGTVYLGYHSPVGVWSYKAVYPGNRLAVKTRAVHMALDFMRRKLRKYEVHEMLESMRC